MLAVIKCDISSDEVHSPSHLVISGLDWGVMQGADM